MYTAKEARERALDIANEKYQKQLKIIQDKIEYAVKQSLLEVTIFEDIDTAVKVELNNLGYNTKTQYNSSGDPRESGYTTVISW